MIELGSHPRLHGQKPVPSANQQSPPPTGLASQRHTTVPGDRVMDCGDNRYARALNIENAISKGLVIVHHIKIIGMLEYPVPSALTECPGLRKSARQLTEPFAPAQWIPQLRERHGHRLSGIQVEARQLDQPDTLNQLRIRWARNHGDLMTERGKRLTQVPQIHPLTAGERCGAIAQQRNPQRARMGNTRAGRVDLRRVKRCVDRALRAGNLMAVAVPQY